MYSQARKRVDYKRIVIAIIIIAYAIIISRNNISNGFWYDDFHLIRNFTNSELVSVWHGTYDTDSFETTGYRPLYVYFNDMRYLLFGENVIAQRIFLVVLFVTIIFLWIYILRKLGLSNLICLIISIFILSARNSAYHFGWLSDGTHLLQGVLFMVSMCCVILFFESTSKWKKNIFFGMVMFTYACNLLVREESVVTLGATILLWIVIIYSSKRKFNKYDLTYTIAFALISGLVTLGIFLLGQHFVPGRVLNINSIGYFEMVKFTIFLGGFLGGDIYYVLAILPIALVLFIYFLARKTQTREYIDRNKPFFLLFIVLLITTLISCSMGFVLARSNLTLFPTIFYCTWIGTGLYLFLDYFRDDNKKKLIVSTLIVILFIPILIINTRNSILLQETLAYPFNVINNSPDMVWGEYASKATIPEARKEKLESELESFGLTPENWQAESDLLLANANRNNIHHPTKQGGVFTPQYGMFFDDYLFNLEVGQ